MCSVLIENIPTEVTAGLLQTCYPKCYMIVCDREWLSEPTETAGSQALIRFESHEEAVQQIDQGTIQLHSFSVESRCNPLPKVVTKCSCLLDIFQSKNSEKLFGTPPAQEEPVQEVINVDMEKTSQKSAKQEKHVMQLEAKSVTSSACNPLQSGAAGNAMQPQPYSPQQLHIAGTAMLQPSCNILQPSTDESPVLQQIHSGIRNVLSVPVQSGNRLALQPYVDIGPYPPQQLVHGMHRPVYATPLPPQPQQFHGMHRPVCATPLPPQPQQFHGTHRPTYPTPLPPQTSQPQQFHGMHRPTHPTLSPPQPDTGTMSNAPLEAEQPPVPIQNEQSSYNTGHQATADVQQPEMTDMSAYLPSHLFSDSEELALPEQSGSNALPWNTRTT